MTLAVPSVAVADVLNDVVIASDCRVASWRSRRIEASEPRDLEKRLGHLLYEVLHLRREEPIGTRARMVRDLAFEAELAAAVPHRAVAVRGRALRDDEQTGQVLVELMSVRVWIPREDLLIDPGKYPALTTVRLDSHHAALSPGFLLAHGSAGVPGPPLMRLYLSPVDDQRAPAVWAEALRVLEAWRHPYRAKVASVRWFYPRTDAITVYIQGNGPADLRELTAGLLGVPHLSAATSLLTQALAPGIAAACEPADQTAGRRGLSFGEHRSSLLAAALLAGHDSGAGWRAHITDVMSQANVDPDALWRNLKSPIQPPTSAAGGESALPAAAADPGILLAPGRPRPSLVDERR